MAKLVKITHTTNINNINFYYLYLNRLPYVKNRTKNYSDINSFFVTLHTE